MRRPLDGIGEHSMCCAWVFLEPHRLCRPLKFSVQNFHSVMAKQAVFEEELDVPEDERLTGAGWIQSFC